MLSAGCDRKQKNAEVKDLVTKVAPAFKAHEDAAQNVLNKIS